MKTTLSILFLIALGLLFSSCRTAARPDATPLAESMKGYELYSWQEANQWDFSLLVGTNREKTLDEIKSVDTVLLDVDALLSTLEKVPPGQYITWSSKETLSFPPDNIIKQVEQVCKDKGLILTIAR
ncbi:MAG TPA: hypothetical protein VK909_04990 [Anaerolineales bacterium]|nr:hypothetical protein [Anaerolineales bacterium]